MSLSSVSCLVRGVLSCWQIRERGRTTVQVNRMTQTDVKSSHALSSVKGNSTCLCLMGVRTSSEVRNQELLAHQLPSQTPSQEYYHWSRCLHNVSASLTITLVSSSSRMDRVHQSGIWSGSKCIPRTLTFS